MSRIPWWIVAFLIGFGIGGVAGVIASRFVVPDSPVLPAFGVPGLFVGIWFALFARPGGGHLHLDDPPEFLP